MTVNDAVTALVDAFRNADVPGVAVFDGQAWDPTTDFLAVGWREDQSGVDFTRTPADAFMSSFQDVITVYCTLGLHQGQWDDAAAIRDATMRAFTAFTAAMRAYDWSQVTMQPPMVTGASLVQRGHEGGSEGTLVFDVTLTVLAAA